MYTAFYIWTGLLFVAFSVLSDITGSLTWHRLSACHLVKRNSGAMLSPKSNCKLLSELALQSPALHQNCHPRVHSRRSKAA